jgi:hypothetical protein
MMSLIYLLGNTDSLGDASDLRLYLPYLLVQFGILLDESPPIFSTLVVTGRHFHLIVLLQY